MDLQIIAAIVFLILLIGFAFVKRKKIKLQKLLFPLFYIILYRTEIGLNFMEKTARKYREFLRIVGYCCIGFGFAGMIYVFVMIIWVISKLIITPKTAESGMALVLPFTNIPGIGYLNFVYFILPIFILMVIHEGAHGIMARVHNVKLKSSGFAILGIFIPVFPGAFVEPDEKELQKKPDHVQYSIFAAGPISNIAAALLVVLFMSFVMAPVEAKITEPVGFSFDVMNESLPAAKAGLRSGMLIDSYNNQSVKKVDKVLEEISYCKEPGDIIHLGNSTKNFMVVLTENPDNPKKGFMGVTNIRNEVRVKPEYKRFKSTFFWFKDFLKWLGFFNLIIGVVNLLPLAILDGGRMSHLALGRIIKNKEKANKVFVFISLLLLLSLVFGLITTYLGNPLAFLK